MHLLEQLRVRTHWQPGQALEQTQRGVHPRLASRRRRVLHRGSLPRSLRHGGLRHGAILHSGLLPGAILHRALLHRALLHRALLHRGLLYSVILRPVRRRLLVHLVHPPAVLAPLACRHIRPAPQ